MENRGLIAAVCSGRPPQQTLHFQREASSALSWVPFLLQQLSADVGERSLHIKCILLEIKTRFLLTEDERGLLLLYGVNLTIGTPVFIWGSALWVVGPLKKCVLCACAGGFAGMSEGSGLSETFASVLMTLSTALYIFFFSCFHFCIFNKGK